MLVAFIVIPKTFVVAVEVKSPSCEQLQNTILVRVHVRYIVFWASVEFVYLKRDKPLFIL